MSFESGSISFRAFYLAQPLPRNVLEKFASRAAPPITTLGEEPIRGWVTGRHLLDNRIEKETAYYAGYLRLTLMKAERKIPESLLRAECRMEELARMQAENRAELDRRTRSEIRQEISNRLLPKMPPTLHGMSLVHMPETDLVYAEAVSDKQLDALEARKTTHPTTSPGVANRPSGMDDRIWRLNFEFFMTCFTRLVRTK